MAEETLDIRVSEIMPELFSDWSTIPFEDALSDSVGQFSKLKQNQTKLEGKYPVVDQGEELINGFVDDQELLYKGDLPVIIFGDHTRRLKFIDFQFAVGADGTKILIPKPFIDIHFFFYYLKSLNIVSEGYSRHYKFLKECRVPLPPLPEQHRIVAKLDAVMQKVEANKQRLNKIPILLKRFRQSVLAAAVSGKLTEDWRGKHGVDEEWEYMKATDACETVASGSTPKNKPFFEKEEIPYLKVYNIVNQKIDFFYKPQYIKRAIHEKELKRCRIYPNDIVINIVGPPLGKVAIIPDTFPEWNINQAIVVFRPKPFLLPMFLYHILCDGKQIKHIELELRGTAGQSNISLTQCRDFDFPIPKLEEQQEVVRRIEQLFAFADKLEARYTKAQTMLDRLPQSILAKTFRGELVAQDPRDEPASFLLERIRVQKAESAGVKKAKPTNVKSPQKVKLRRTTVK